MPHSITQKHRPKRDATDTRPNEKKRRKLRKEEADAMTAAELKVRQSYRLSYGAAPSV